MQEEVRENKDVNETLAIIKSSPQGAKIVYYRGFLLEDRGTEKAVNANIRYLASGVYKLYLDGFVTLVQRKISDGSSQKKPVYEYIAIVSQADGREERALKNLWRHRQFAALPN